MEIYQLRTFVAVAQQGHLTQAAEILHLSQPAVTAQIKALEEEMGVSLFERSAGGVTLTKAGQLLLPEAEAILAGARGLITMARGLQGHLTGKVRIGTIADPALLRLADILVEIHRRYPLLDAQTSHSISGVVLNDVRKKELDCGFFIGKNPYVNVHAIAVRELVFRVVAPVAWQDKLANATWKDVGRLPWVWINQFNSYNKLTNELFREHNISPQKVFELDQERTTLALVKAGVGMSLMREELAQEALARGDVIEWGNVRKTASLNFIWPAERDGDLLITAMLDIVRSVWQLPEQAPVAS
ncbi:DNA-binding transcriptional LysR family regulator [Chitinivorax tropicus]|uniref:DNA-binding transcriptional LysR family regulator n=1 Tax=Chitinivorax tropicus TaxID=714531 RepID=A0A840MQB2_9PROT|nr:LysR family transcriptional regulator [Chitinivorax tropicus]MBB5019269.1 DNA-binding transcriptional LysR family regulator [Chitinivorax tropicus]